MYQTVTYVNFWIYSVYNNGDNFRCHGCWRFSTFCSYNNYLFEIPASLAITYGLFVVGITSLFGSIKYLKLGLINFKKSIYFVLFSLLSIYFVRVYLLNKIPSELFIYWKSLTKDSILICIFAFIMILSAFSMIKNTQFNNYPKKYEARAFIMGLIVGVITGLVGAGGGFLIVPTLTIFSRLKFKEAIGTSLY